MQDPVEQPWVKNDQPGVPAAGGRPWKELLSNGRIDPAYPRPQVQDLAVLGYTSGTTGRPKAQLRKGQLRNASHLKAHSFKSAQPLPPRKRVFHCAPASSASAVL